MKNYNVPNKDIIIAKAHELVLEKLNQDKWYEIDYDNGDPYDKSGDTKLISVSKQEYIENVDVDDSKYPFCVLDFIYLGYWTPTYESWHGKHHVSVKDYVSEETERFLLSEYVRVNEKINDFIDSDGDWEEVVMDDMDYYDYLIEIEKVIKSYTKEKIINFLKNGETYAI
jgi:hypothetical protein